MDPYEMLALPHQGDHPPLPLAELQELVGKLSSYFDVHHPNYIPFTDRKNLPFNTAQWKDVAVLNCQREPVQHKIAQKVEQAVYLAARKGTNNGWNAWGLGSMTPRRLDLPLHPKYTIIFNPIPGTNAAATTRVPPPTSATEIVDRTEENNEQSSSRKRTRDLAEDSSDEYKPDSAAAGDGEDEPVPRSSRRARHRRRTGTQRSNGETVLPNTALFSLEQLQHLAEFDQYKFSVGTVKRQGHVVVVVAHYTANGHLVFEPTTKKLDMREEPGLTAAVLSREEHFTDRSRMNLGAFYYCGWDKVIALVHFAGCKLCLVVIWGLLLYLVPAAAEN
jgi:hypothetical protein